MQPTTFSSINQLEARTGRILQIHSNSVCLESARVPRRAERLDGRFLRGSLRL